MHDVVLVQEGHPLKAVGRYGRSPEFLKQGNT